MNLKFKNRERIFRLGYLTILFDNHTQRQLLEQSLKIEQNYTDLEKTADLINFFKMGDQKVFASSLWRDDSKTADECIRLKEAYDDFLEISESFKLRKDDVAAIMNSLEHSNKVIMMKTRHVLYARVMSLYMIYAGRNISKSELLHQLQAFKNLPSVLSYEPKIMFRTMVMMEGEIDAVLDRRRRREKDNDAVIVQ